MLEIKDLTIKIGGVLIIDNLSFTLNENDKLAIIGEEGNGKSTLLKVIRFSKLEYADISGTINTKNNSIGYLKQQIDEADSQKLVIDYVFGESQNYKLLYKTLNELNLDERILNKKICILSGGEKVKIQLLKILLENNDILLLDEPSNDLDINTLKWLEEFIKSSKKPIIFVSHDETLLSNTANIILHLELVRKKRIPKSTVSRDGYTDYVDNRLRKITKQTQVSKSEKQKRKKQEEKLTQIRNKVEYRQETITRADPHGGKLLAKKMKSIKAQEKRFDETKLTEMPDYEEEINIIFNDVYVPNSKQILNIELSELKIDSKLLSNDIKLSVVGNQKIVIIGKNGCGKTTLLKLIYEQLKTRDDIKTGYMPQNYDDILNNYETPIDFLLNSSDVSEIALVRSLMGNLNFTKEEMTSPLTYLSGGSKAKLIILKLIYNSYNVLILDEPTRNVSPLSNPVIRNALQNFKGTIISVSHDRKYIDICDIVYELNEKGLKEINKESI